MRFKTVLGCTLALSALAVPTFAQQPQPGLSGKWTMTAEIFGSPTYLTMELKQEGNKPSGTHDRRQVEAHSQWRHLHLLAAQRQR